MGVGARVTLLRSLVKIAKGWTGLGKLNYKLRHTSPVLCETQDGGDFWQEGKLPKSPVDGEEESTIEN